MTHMATQPNPADDDRHWQAFCYLQGEMSADEAEQFEQQMLNDADLCAAVAETSLLTSAVSAVPPATITPALSTAGRKTSSGRRVTASLAVAAAVCCCAAATLYLSVDRSSGTASSSVTGRISDADFLVTAWADSMESESEPETGSPETTDDEELNVPDWMLAAVSDHQPSAAEDGGTVENDRDSEELL